MKAKNILAFAWNSLRYRKLRTSLTILGIVISTTLIIILTSQTQGLYVGITGQLSKIGVKTVWVYSNVRTFQLTPQTVGEISQVEGVDFVAPLMIGSAALYTPNNVTTVQVIGVDNIFLPQIFTDLAIMDGNLLGEFDYGSVVLGNSVAFPLEGEESTFTVGQTVTVSFAGRVGGRATRIDRFMTVKGVLAQYGSSVGISIDDKVFISPSEAVAILGGGAITYSAIIVGVKTVDVVNSVITSLQTLYGSRIRIFAPSQVIQTVTNVLSNVENFLLIISSIALVVAGIGIANVMYISVLERYRIIGLMKAIGAKDRTVLALFLTESALIGLIGSVIGLITGIAGSEYIGNFLLRIVGIRATGQRVTVDPTLGAPGLSVSPVFSLQVMLTAVSLSLVTSLLAGLYPAWKASRLPPATAIKYE